MKKNRWLENITPKLPVSLESLMAEAVEKDYFITFEQMHPSLAKLKRGKIQRLPLPKFLP